MSTAVRVLIVCSLLNAENVEAGLRESDKDNLRFLKPYLRDWMQDLAATDRDIGGAINRGLSEALKQTPLTDMSGVSLTFVEGKPASDQGRALAEVHVARNGQIVALLRAKISDKGVPEYQFFPSSSVQTNTLGTTLSSGTGGVSVDLDGDGAKDTVTLQATGVTVSRYTGFGFTSEDRLASYIFNVRLGYMAGYYSALSKGSQSGSRKSQVAPEEGLRGDMPVLVELAGATIDSRFNCTNYDLLFDRRFVLGQSGVANQLDMQAVKQGMSVGWADGEVDAETLGQINNRTAFLGETKKVKTGVFSSVNIPKDETALRTYAEAISDMVEFPIFKVTFKDQTSGITLSPQALSALDSVSGDKVREELKAVGDLTDNLVKKLSDPSNNKLAPVCKPLGGTVLICNPAIAAGRAVAFLSVLAAVSSPAVGEKLMAAHNPSEVSIRIRRDIAAMNQPLDPKTIRGMAGSVTGIAALQFREGFRASTLFLDNALAEQFREAGRREAAQEIVDFLKTKFSDFKPGPIATLEDAKRYIAQFIGMLYTTIAELQKTVTTLNARLEELKQTIDNLNKALAAAEETIKAYKAPGENLGRITGVLADAARVFQVGSSLLVATEVANLVAKPIESGFSSLKKALRW